MVFSDPLWRHAWSTTAGLPVVVRWAMRCGVVLGAVGALAGLVIGLVVHPPTAWFAVLELGVPAFVLGAALGAVVGALAAVVGRRGGRRRGTPHTGSAI
ncbi:hypothetical protein ABFT23_13055 [Nocardioides sp. C4-1]|uniref:hypothetical protein n=1 Tax=Nocardioides sp. C4-1 TaxID=3151851 RepID=UPI0032677778